MKVLVSAASKHGATTEIAEELGKVLSNALQERGIGGDEMVDVLPTEEISSVESYDAVVLGSAVYAGHWLKSARELAERHADALFEKPVWLFSSGPIGDPPKPEEEPVDVAGILESTRAREHRISRVRSTRVPWGSPRRPSYWRYGRPRETSVIGKR